MLMLLMLAGIHLNGLACGGTGCLLVPFAGGQLRCLFTPIFFFFFFFYYYYYLFYCYLISATC